MKLFRAVSTLKFFGCHFSNLKERVQRMNSLSVSDSYVKLTKFKAITPVKRLNSKI